MVVVFRKDVGGILKDNKLVNVMTDMKKRMIGIENREKALWLLVLIGGGVIHLKNKEFIFDCRIEQEKKRKEKGRINEEEGAKRKNKTHLKY